MQLITLSSTELVFVWSLSPPFLIEKVAVPALAECGCTRYQDQDHLVKMEPHCCTSRKTHEFSALAMVSDLAMVEWWAGWYNSIVTKCYPWALVV